jgi:alkanesulfonate monooxygenase SsuD/methylene tetrahydromethanopterin reductase-like flavin-dependent oxidoreductase (luciferase family)
MQSAKPASTASPPSSDSHVLDGTVALLRDAWEAKVVTGDRALCPAPVRIPILFGGKSEATIRRVATTGDGWSAGALRLDISLKRIDMIAAHDALTRLHAVRQPTLVICGEHEMPDEFFAVVSGFLDSN